MKKILLSIFVFSLMFSFAIKTWAMPTDRYVSEVPPRTLMVGIKGSDVQVLQQALIDKGFLSGKADGSFGQKTRMALIAFQKANNLKLDGKAGTQTFKLLNNILPPVPNPSPISDCDATTQSIKVLSPNGGETYTFGQPMVVKWSTCNIPTDYQVTVVLKSANVAAGREIVSVHNTGTTTVTVPTTSGYGDVFAPGKFYKINLQVEGSMGHVAPSDSSDNLFTIN